VERLDEERIDVLRRWGEGLSTDSREEVRAAGRAILILIDEVEQLHVDLWNERSRGTAEPSEQPEAAPPAGGVHARIGAWFVQLRRREPEAEEAETDLSTAPPRAGE